MLTFERLGTWLVGIATGILLSAACGVVSEFVCDNHEQCGRGGTCEATGFCSFPDPDCPSQSRYGEFAAPGLAGTCVESEEAADTDPAEETSDTAPEGGTSTTDGEPDPDTTNDGPPDETTGEPVEPGCGDGVLDDGESCDDGNGVDGDGCNVDCTESGQLMWSKTSDGPAGGEDVFEGLTVTEDGFVIGGTQTTSSGARDGFIGRYDLDGQELWSTTIDRAGADDGFRRLTVDDQGRVYAAGVTTSETTGRDVWVVALDESGELQWQHVWGIAGSDTGIDVMATDDGLFVGGCLDDRSVAFVRRHGLDGAVQWTVERPAAGGDACAHGLFLDGDAVFVAGWTSEVETGEDMWVARYDLAGTEVWSDTTSPGLNDRLHEIVPFQSDVVAVGRLGDGPNKDVWLRRYDRQGEAIWTRTLKTASEVSAMDAVPTPDGGLVVVGWERSEPGVGDTHGFVHRLDVEGNTMWRRDVAGSGAGDAWLGRAAQLSDGRVLVVGYITEASQDGWIGVFSP